MGPSVRGTPRVPLISWQDRRAADRGAERNASARHVIVARISGLALSAHYAGPKLAALREQDERLAAQLDRRRVVVRKSRRLPRLALDFTGANSRNGTDDGRADGDAVELSRSDWSGELLRRFGMPRISAMPTIVPSGARRVELDWGRRCSAASLADQASGALSVLDAAEATPRWSTWAPAGSSWFRRQDARERRAGYLTAPILGDRDGEHRFVLEGSINGAGSGPGSLRAGRDVGFPNRTRRLSAFAVPGLRRTGFARTGCTDFQLFLSRDDPDAEPVGSAADRGGGTTCSASREILEGLAPETPPGRLLLSGGLAGEPALGPGTGVSAGSSGRASRAA